jgi:prepilin-type N-terminal cleavage/methylation domain-containing protein
VIKRPIRGFTLIELLVVVGLLALLIGILLPALARAREASRRTLCSTNLAWIGRAMNTYAASEARYPLQPPQKSTRFGTWNNPPAAGAVEDGFDPIAELYRQVGVSSPTYRQMGQPMANLWLLILQGLVTPKHFICLSDPVSPQPAQVRTNHAAFDGTYLTFGTLNDNPGTATTFSYAFAYPFMPGDNPHPPWWWRGSSRGDVPLGADIGPSMTGADNDPTAPAGSARSNSKNHSGGVGQNVLYGDNHVAFEKTNAVGIRGDNLFTADSGTIYVKTRGAAVNSPARLNADPDDILLVPARP